MIARGGRSDATGDVVVTGEDVRHERAENVERCSVTESPLQLHVELDLIERDVARSFDHDLHALTPSSLSQFAQRDEFAQLRFVRRVGEATGAEAVTDRERHVVLTHDITNVFPVLIHRVLFAVDQHPLGEQRPAATDDADESLGDVRQMLFQHAGVNREVIDSLRGLLFE